MYDNVNLLAETILAIAEGGHTIEDIVFIGSLKTGHSCDWQHFSVLSDREYDAGFGGNEVMGDLRIIFSDGKQLWRGEYDGSEWWEQSPLADIPAEDARKPIETLFGHYFGCDW